MKLNNKGFLITGILYSLLLLFLILIVGMVAILSARQNKLDYISRDIITKLNDKYDFNIARSWSFDYTGDYQVFTVPTDGYYNIELWGAQGGSMTDGSKTYNGGAGAYTKGTIYLTKGENLYIYIGGKGSNNVSLTSCSDNGDAGGYNGGGSLQDGQCVYGSSGGGATDIRLTSGTWDDFNGLKSRLMVAAGGGGANFRNQGYGEGNGGAGGAFVGESGVSTNHTNGYGYGISTGATQISGGIPIWYPGTHNYAPEDHSMGKFGRANTGDQTGGGSGYYGGGGSSHGGAGGGSSFVSGLYGCDAITAESTEDAIVHTGQPNHYSGKVFSNGIMIAGDDNMPTHDGTSTMVGNTGNGYAKISLLSSPPKSYTMTNLIQNGSFENDNVTWTAWTATLEKDSTKYSTGSHSLKATAIQNNSTVGTIFQYKAYLGHIYYASANIIPYNFEHNITLRFGYLSDTDSGGNTAYGAYIRNNTIGTTKKTNFDKVTYMYTFDKQTAKFDEDGSAFNTITIWNNTNKMSNTGEYYNVDDVLVVDLTESFGAGNEPTKEWCDENISYFDGTSTIYK